MTSNLDDAANRKRPRDATSPQDDGSIKRLRSHDGLEYDQGMNGRVQETFYMQPQQQQQPHPQQQRPQADQDVAQPPLWNMATQQTPQQYYNVPPGFADADTQPPLPAAPFSALPNWSQPPQPAYSYTNVFDNWNYQIDEPCVYGQDASQHLKLQSLSTLDNLSTQIILNLSKGSLNDIMLLTAGRDYEDSQAYFTRRTLFDQTRKVYAKGSVFIDMHNLHSYTQSQQEVIRKANRATFISSILEGHDISFFDLDSRFLETFIPTGQRLFKWQGTIFLELKTQAYIAALMNNDGTSETLLDELFPNDLPDQLLARHPDAPNLAPSEQDFLDRARARKQYLFNEPAYDAFTTLPRKYGWHDFLREFAVAINKNVESIINNPARTPASQPASAPLDIFGYNRQSSSPATRLSHLNSSMPSLQRSQSRGGQYTSTQPGALEDTDPRDPQVQNTPLQQIRALAGQPSATPDSVDSASSPQHKARPRPPKTSSTGGTQRQPWKQEEEDALMAGLSEVNGPHWSQILSLYGRGGSVSEVLKDRNQIQLKDKARNLKLWYLKMGNEVPECLRGVTGELRKRGGARVRAALGLTDDDDGGGSSVVGGLKKSPGRAPTPGGGGGGRRIDPSLDG